ncbi:Uncharacterised protein [Sebaldella termitidis]|uniref:Phage protein Gp138 N-terminal domain-containing protein n=1 Tax=Sebaldella termitidis (strain ATCC 33386 / NCTC 11300) TaxID=526218 RepID=D1AN62_SEBTE|nr:Gp138 family membrane-puncturing spike protein [Sebaldella termitidis]ACZ09666.1 hypothetical protein Sterm_2822 [Sebaldella termitidis ATCC 33386]SUI24998.1 Uncharacterised protein [Sebaldella termitidis]
MSTRDDVIILNEISEKTKQGAKDEIHTTLLAKITRVNNVKMTCSITFLQPALQQGEQVFPPDTDNVPIKPIFSAGKFMCNVPYAIGDVVKVDFSERSIDEILFLKHKEPTATQDYRQFSFNDGIVVGGFADENKYPEDFYILHTSGTYIRITEEGKILTSGEWTHEGNLTIKGSSTAEDHISDGISGKNHLHGGITIGSSKTQKPE